MAEYQLAEKLRNLVGLVSTSEGEALFELAKQSIPGVIVEIGSHQGKSTAYLAAGSAEGHQNKVYAVDLWLTGSNPHWNKPEIWQNFLHQTGEWEDLIRPVMGHSLLVAKGWTKADISVLFIDAQHTYKAARADFLAWYPHLRVGGFLAFDDVDKQTVQRVLDLAQETGTLSPWETVGKVSFARRIR